MIPNYPGFLEADLVIQAQVLQSKGYLWVLSLKWKLGCTYSIHISKTPPLQSSVDHLWVTTSQITDMKSVIANKEPLEGLFDDVRPSPINSYIFSGGG